MKGNFMRTVLFGSIISLFLLSHSLQAKDFTQHPVKGKQYETLVVRFAEKLGFENPFDLTSNHIELVIVQPDFTRRTLSFFYDGTNEQGIEQWEARFAPKQSGLYSFAVAINGKERDRFTIVVDPNKDKNQGGLRLSAHYGVFQYESGEAFRGNGLNVCWADDYAHYFKAMHDAGMNTTRIWMCPWHLPFEWQETGLGRYNLATARRLDSILVLAQKYNIYILLCFDYHGIAPKGLGYFKSDRWLENPYNKRNGGPCVERKDLFTDPTAKQFSKQKYKYIISRFGSCAHIAAWEFYNEADLMAGQAIPINQWHVEMAEYVHTIDVHERLVSSSSTRRYVEKLVDAFKSPALDFIMFHDYNSLDFAPHITYLHEAALEYYKKPIVLAEFGVEYRGGDLTFKVDSQHVGLHNGIWAGWFNETPIIPLTWWWDNYVDKYNLWFEFKNLHRFTEQMNFNVNHLVFKTLASGYVEQTHEQVYCFVRSIYYGEHCALWLKNDEYKWWMVNEGKVPQVLGPFVQVVPDLLPGKYSIRWYDPQRGEFTKTTSDAMVKDDGVLMLTVPTFSKDLACIIQRIK
jgi:hypothetical protein